jgi:hypothetical protein
MTPYMDVGKQLFPFSPGTSIICLISQCNYTSYGEITCPYSPCPPSSMNIFQNAKTPKLLLAIYTCAIVLGDLDFAPLMCQRRTIHFERMNMRIVQRFLIFADNDCRAAPEG